MRSRWSAKNSRGKGTAISTQTAVVAGQHRGGGGIINLPGGGKSVDVVDVPKGERLIVDTVASAQPGALALVVDHGHRHGEGHARLPHPQRVVFLRSTPILTSTPTDAQTATDGRDHVLGLPRSDFPLKNGYSVQFFVKAYRKGDPTLAGISGTRLVQVATAPG